PELRQRPELAEGTAWPVSIALDAAAPPAHALALIVPRGGGPRLSYDPSAISEDRANDVARQLATLAAAAARSPDAPVAELALLDERERAAVVDECNRTVRPY